MVFMICRFHFWWVFKSPLCQGVGRHKSGLNFRQHFAHFSAITLTIVVILHDLQVFSLSTSDLRGSGHELIFDLWQVPTVFWGELFLLFRGRLLLFAACIWSLWWTALASTAKKFRFILNLFTRREKVRKMIDSVCSNPRWKFMWGESAQHNTDTIQ